MLPSAERQEVASLAANGLQSDVKMAAVVEMSLQLMPALSARLRAELRWLEPAQVKDEGRYS